ncbi:MAG: hypothetical protein IKT46_06630 [Clostridia bacterium]|nr:hypothetical protein [Clostridia bacterium]
MKKLCAILALALVLAMTLAMTVSAGPHGIVENAPITFTKTTPTVDGTINGDEGWSTSALMNAETLGYYWHQNPLTMDGNVKFAWDEENFYYCADIVEGLSAVREADGFVYEEGSNQFNYSTGEDWIDVDTNDPTLHYGYDGDVFGLMIDPLNIFIEYGFTGNQDYTPWYLIGLFEGDVAKMYRQKVNAGDITDQVKVEGKKTDKGWCFEAAIPWDIIIKDVEDITYSECIINKADLFKDGAVIKTSCIYQDRFIDEEAGEVATFGRYITAPTTLADGNPGHAGSGDNAMSCGITLNVSNPASSNDDSATGDDTEFVTDESGNAVTDASGNKVTQKATSKTTTKKATTGTTTGGNAAQTFDMGIAIAVGALAVSGIGLVASKKRR